MKGTREKYLGNKELEFVFITDEKSSPAKDYAKFVNEQALKNTFKLSEDDFFYLRELFQFNGIPRYVLLGKDGKVLNNNFEMHNFSYEIKKLVPSLVVN